LLCAVDLQKWNDSYKTALEDWARLLSLFNNVTAAVLRLEASAERITNHSQTISSYGLRILAAWRSG